MRIDPSLRALRGDPASQRSAQTAIEAAKRRWLDHPQLALIQAELAEYGAGQSLERLDNLQELLSSLDHAQSVLGAWASETGRTLAEQPFAHAPFRHQYSDGVGVVQLLQEGRATLSLVLDEGGGGRAAESVCFSSGRRHELCVAGEARFRCVEIAEAEGATARLAETRRTLEPGDTLAFDNARQTKLIDEVGPGGVVILRLSLAATAPQPAREYRLADGALLHQAAGDREESRQELAMALLGAMERRDAAPAMQAVSREGSPQLRWQAVRQCLALDSGAGFAALSAIASDSADTLAAPARTLRKQLLAAHPELAQVEELPCPA